MTKRFLDNLKYDIPAGVVVFLIALPLCLGIALASGAPLLSGLISGIVGGIITGYLSKSPFSVSGPAAGLTAIVLVAITQLGSFEVFLSAVVLAGVIQLALGFLKAGSITAYFPSNVIKGMLTAIGIIIIMKQIPYAVGYHEDSEGSLSFIEENGHNTISSMIGPLMHINFGPLIIALVSLFIILLWERPFMKKIAVIPGALVAVVVATMISEFFTSSVPSLALTDIQLVNIPLANGFKDFMSAVTLPDFSQVMRKDVLIAALTVAAVASIETLLNIEAVDKLDPLKRSTPPNRELKAQGIGNIISGLIGGLPITSVIVRSSANVNAQAKSKTSAIFHGFLLLVCTFSIPFLLNKIPLSALAAILLVTGYKLAKISVFKEMFKKGKHQWIPFVVTVVAIVFTDLLTGIITGLAASVFSILRGNMKMSYFFHRQEHQEGEAIRIELAQEVSFLNKASIKNTLNHLPENSTVWIDASHSSYIDHDVLELIREFRDYHAKEKSIDLHLTGFKEVYEIENSRNVVSKDLQEVYSDMTRNNNNGGTKPYVTTSQKIIKTQKENEKNESD